MLRKFFSRTGSGLPQPSWPWAGETFMMAVCAASLVVMIVLLRAYDGHSIFHWHSVTLNAVISVLSVIMKGALTSVAATCIGQWKWILFTRERCPVLDFEKIDKASRGSWGFFSVLTRGHVPNAVKFGASLVFLSMAVGPFSQQLIQFKSEIQFKEATDLTVARAMGYARGLLSSDEDLEDGGSDGTSSQIKPQIDATMEASILYGIFGEGILQGQLEMYCPTRDCRWNKFLTAGVCSQCNDVTSKLTRHDKWAYLHHNGSTVDDNMSAYFLPNGAYLANIDGDITSVDNGENVTTSINVKGNGKTMQITGLATGDPSKTISLTENEALIWAISTVQINQTALTGHTKFDYSWPDIPVIATECGIYYCGLEITSNMTNGLLYEQNRELDLQRVKGSYRPEPGFSAPTNISDSLEFDPDTAMYSRTPLVLDDPKDASVNFTFTEEGIMTISNYLQTTFQTKLNITRLPGMDDVSVTLQSPDMPTGHINMAFFDMAGLPKKSEGLLQLRPDRNLTQRFSALSTSMTFAIRNTLAGQETAGDNGGEAGEVLTVYAVQWPWITLHAVLFVAGAAFYVVTVVSSTNAEKEMWCLAWKNSGLAVMSKAGEMGPLFAPGDSVRELERKAAEKTARFESKDGERLEAQEG